MAADLRFPILFDLEKGVEQAIKDWDGKYAAKLEKAIQKRALDVKLKFDTKAFDNLDDVKRRLAQLKIEPITPETKASIKELARELQVLAKALEQVQKYSKTTQLGQQNFRNDVQMEKLRQANERLEIQKRRVALVEQKHADAMQRSATRSKQLGNEYQKQSSYLSNLLKKTAALWSLHKVSAFLTNVRQVTAEFELQRISLGAIIQDHQRANQLFAEIKSFALTSPLKILDLTKYTKQVAAYGFETEKLFDTTKMLADISVGLGTDIGRASLFFGQVYATGYLRASELRQATEMGIPLVDKLTQKLEELNGKAYTAADVMDLISKRAISFEMVEQVFKDMTSEGGEFYNMQIKQSQTLFGMWSKLGDAAAIMYDQIGNSSVVNATMKTMIRFLELMMRNWQTTGRILSTLTVGIGTYVLMLKNAAIASNAVAIAEARRLTVEKGELIIAPKLLTAIIGKGIALSLSIKLTDLHTAAMARQMAATNLLTKTFWRLTAAMLANPWAVAVAAIVATGVALFHFIGNAETAAERAEKLNNSVASLKNLDDTTKPLIDTYNELINKTERTAEEQKKLSEVTHELAKQYPGAITAIGNFGAEVELAADKLNQLYQAEKQARMENTRYELDQTEKKIKEVEAEIEKYQQQLASGEKTIYKRLGDSGLRTKKVVPLTEEDKGNILKRIDELRYGEDGQSGLVGLQQSAEAARRALGLIPSEAAQAVEKFGAWKKTLTTFRKQVGDIRVQLFDDSTIAQFGSLEEALKKTAEEYKKNIALVKVYDEVLKSATLTAEERAKIEGERAEADTMANLAEQALKYFNALSLLNAQSSSGRQSDPRLQTLQQIANKMAEVNKEYDELLKKEGQTKALADTQKLFASSFKQMEAVAKKYKFQLPAFEVPQTIEDVQKWYQAIIDEINRLGIKNADKVLIELGFKRDKSAIDKQQKDIEAQIKELTDRISRTKTAKEFYDKVLGMTGDINLAANVSLALYDTNGQDLQKQIKERLQTLVDSTSVELPDTLFRADDTIDTKALRKWAKENEKLLGEGDVAYQELVKIANEADKDLQKTIENWLKATEKAKTYSDKLLDLTRTTALEIARINTQKQHTQADIDKILGLPDADSPENQAKIESLRSLLGEYDVLINRFKAKQAEENTKLSYEAFKDSPMYVQIFDDLDSASSAMLENMKTRIERLKGVWKDLDPTQLKELQSRLNEIENQQMERNPFKSLIDGIKEYRKLTTQGDKRGNKSKDEAESDLNAAAQRTDIAKEAYFDVLSKYIKDGENYNKLLDRLQKENVDGAKEVSDARKELNDAMSNEKSAQKAVQTWDKVTKKIKLSTKEIIGLSSSIGDIASGIATVMESLGADEEDVQYFRDIADALNQITGGIQNIVNAAMNGNIAGIVSSSISAVPNIFAGFVNLFSAGKVKRANKEIKRQQEILDNLQHSYSRLQAAQDKALGVDFVTNQKRQIENLEAQQRAYLRQAEAERSKGKKKDNDKIKEYENAARDIADQIRDMEGQIAAQMFGSDLASTARDFAQAWLDAYKEFGNTTDKMKEKFQDLIQSMVVESVLARVMQKALEPAFDMVDNMNESDFYSQAFWEKLSTLAAQGAENANAGATTMMRFIESAGINVRSMGDDFTGISRDIASASEESINGLAATMNTWSYYVSYMPQVAENVWAIRKLMENGTELSQGSSGYTDLLTLQNQSMSHLQAINQHTAETVAECRRIALACEEEVAQLKRVIVPRGTKGSYVVSTSINS